MSEYGRKYFDGEGYGSGKGDFYRDFPQHYRTAEIILDRKPESVLEVGGARGYVCKILQAHGVPATCMDISEHCWHTRAIKEFILWDATNTPWITFDKLLAEGFKYDLCFSIAFLEHIPEDKLEPMIKEMARVTKRGLHGISVKEEVSRPDPTHATIKHLEWWRDLFKRVAPDYPVEILDKESMENPQNLAKMAPDDGLVKYNIGCFADMFYYGWTNIDSLNLQEWARIRGYEFVQMDILKGVTAPDNSVDIILASHFLEHLTREEGAKFLRDCYRVLKPNGLLRLAIPDAKLLAQKYLDGTIMEYRHVNIGVDNAPDMAEAFFHLLLAGHKTIYDELSLWDTVFKAGFQNILALKPFESSSKVVELQTIPMYPTLSLYVEAIKPKTLEANELPRVVAESPATRVEILPDSTQNKVKTDKIMEEKATQDGTQKLTSTHVKANMKIALLSTPLLKVPPENYGGLELIVANLGMELAKLGHDVTIFAPSGSKVEGCTMVDVGEAKNTVFIDWLRAERDMLDKIKDQLKGFDIIHGHNWFGMEYAYKAQHPEAKVCHTHHGGLLADWWTKTRAPFKLNMVGISNWMKTVYEGMGIPTRVCYNGVDMSKYPMQKEKSDRYLWMSRIAFFKSPHKAIEIAKELGLKLDVAGATQFVEDAKYVEEIRKSCDGDQIRFIGEVSNERKVELLQNAKAMLVTAKWGEPFGLHVLEAMSCGTPVVAIADGGISETLKYGGILCDDLYTMKDVLTQGFTILPTVCRKNAEMFSSEKMAVAYEKAYRDIIAGNEW